MGEADKARAIMAADLLDAYKTLSQQARTLGEDADSVRDGMAAAEKLAEKYRRMCAHMGTELPADLASYAAYTEALKLL